MPGTTFPAIVGAKTFPEKPQKLPSPDLSRNRLKNLLNQRHELYRLADLIDWSMFDSAFAKELVLAKRLLA